MAGFSDLFLDAIKAAGKTDKELGELAGVSNTQMNRVRNRERGLTIGVIDKLTEALGLTVRIEVGGEPIASNETGHDFRDALVKFRKFYDYYGFEGMSDYSGPDPTDAQILKFVVRYVEDFLHMYIPGRSSRERRAERR
jgi:transcriptional regulator with XRE-family HTH domain